MVKKKLAIISSYDELCGNASYTKVLADGLSKYYDVSVIALNVEVLRNGERAAGEVHIQDICQQLKSFDCVNIQFEAGLFGSELSLMLDRFLAIAKASKKLVLTMHRFHAKIKYPTIKRMVKAVLGRGFKNQIKDIQLAYASNRYVPLYHKVIAFCKKNNAPILVHTKRDAELIRNKCKYDNVYDHPLCFYSQQHLKTLREEYSKQQFYTQFSLDSSKKYIGIFGFINEYKNHKTVIKALKYLPQQYELLIFGSQHPHTIKLDENVNPYIDSLLKLITKEEVDTRVKFYGSLNDDDFLKALLSCDFNVLPYLEVNQGGSAIAALSLETSAKTIFSQNRAFLELARYAPNGFKMFSIGNYLELAQAIIAYRESDYKDGLNEYQTKYNANANTLLYHKLLERDIASCELELQMKDVTV